MQPFRILVVDDEPVARQSLSDILRLEGYSVNSVPNGQAAVEYVRTHSVDLMIVDLRMPGMDGLQASRHIRSDETLKHPPHIVLVTAFGREEVREEAERLIGDDPAVRAGAFHMELVPFSPAFVRKP